MTPRKTHPGRGGGDDSRMVVALVQATLLVPGCRSLKEKRSVVKGLVETARHRFHASVAEVGALDLLQRAEIGAALVANDARLVTAEAEKLVAFLGRHPDARLVDHQVEVL